MFSEKERGEGGEGGGGGGGGGEGILSQFVDKTNFFP